VRCTASRSRGGTAIETKALELAKKDYAVQALAQKELPGQVVPTICWAPFRGDPLVPDLAAVRRLHRPLPAAPPHS
jgi:hypothetical protein